MKVKYIGTYPIKYIRANGGIELVNPNETIDVSEGTAKELSKKLWQASNKKAPAISNKKLENEGDK